jgi:hypothetical protein
LDHEITSRRAARRARDTLGSSGDGTRKGKDEVLEKTARQFRLHGAQCQADARLAAQARAIARRGA